MAPPKQATLGYVKRQGTIGCVGFRFSCKAVILAENGGNFGDYKVNNL